MLLREDDLPLADAFGGCSSFASWWWAAMAERLHGRPFSLTQGLSVSVRADGSVPPAIRMRFRVGTHLVELGLPPLTQWAADGPDWEQSEWRDLFVFDRAQPLLHWLGGLLGADLAEPHVAWSSVDTDPIRGPALNLRLAQPEGCCRLRLTFDSAPLAQSFAVTLEASLAEEWPGGAAGHGPIGEEQPPSDLDDVTDEAVPAEQGDEVTPDGDLQDVADTIRAPQASGPLAECRPLLAQLTLVADEIELLEPGAGVNFGDPSHVRRPLWLRAGAAWGVMATVTASTSGAWHVDGSEFTLSAPAAPGRRLRRGEPAPAAGTLTLLGPGWNLSVSELLSLSAGTDMPAPSGNALVLIDGEPLAHAWAVDAAGALWQLGDWLR